MNLKNFIVVFALLTIGFSFAQPIKIGVKAGLNLSNCHTSMSFGELYNNKLGYHFGIIGLLNSSETFGVQPEILYSRQGFVGGKTEYRFYADQAPSYATPVFHFDYLNLPVMLNYSPIGKLSLQAGPQLGLLLNHSINLREVSGDISEFEDELTSTDASSLSTFDFGLAFGAQVNLQKWLIQLRYILGITGIAKNGEGIQNRNLQLSLGYFLK
ncbi:MAG TPA: porin family protein [Flavobacteriaceae bacterium]|nr:PorT family protein [Flavobacteriaceae bacterium]MCB9213362.1 PorT family protein [Alteromonas sp.]HPF10254.1 porin family protein [Flavobacteriaceae bacterium]HQU20700.1 porin family protein [Flavobacteriaceae bacterium]HQU64882.1 porin family protein [Flavobacteriaceae bacterium]